MAAPHTFHIFPLMDIKHHHLCALECYTEQSEVNDDIFLSVVAVEALGVSDHAQLLGR